MTYDVACVCGQAVRGERQGRHQVVTCPGCGRGVFVLPASPFGGVPAAAPPPRGRAWRGPLVAAGVCVVAVLAGFAAVLPYLARPGARVAEEKTANDDPQELSRKVKAARAALQEGKFHVAARLCDEAVLLRLHRREPMTAAESRDLDQLWRETQLLARLSPRSVEEMVRHAMLVRDAEEWAGHFADYQGRSLVFDDVVRRDGEGLPVLGNYVVEVPGMRVRLALEDLTLLRDLPLDDEPRLIFGARLARCGREEGGVWVVRFEPESGVLLTEVGAVEACFPAPADAELQAVLRRQKQWLEER